MQEYWIYLIPLAAVGYFLWSRRSASAADVKGLLERGAQIVDVRTKAEFKAGGHPKAINIPLDQLEARMGDLDRGRPVLVCCETGARSGSGVALLKAAGFQEVANLGSWRRIQSLMS
ncbi:MAG TPA: rhodanese-like domain-containing protein [Geothrix sp.]|nr:rhodanese-like domain-containing protein [Geothrix sp.]